jgi:hypothetical protein
MRTLWRGITRVVFWSYERGTWPYDLMVVAIVMFVLLTPARWFKDKPQAGEPVSSDVQLLSEDFALKTHVYRLDAKVLAPEKRALKATPELERETHDILGRNVDGLKGHLFQVLSINAVRADDGSVSYYEVTVRP